MEKKVKSYTDRYTLENGSIISNVSDVTRTVKSVTCDNTDWVVSLPVQPDQQSYSDRFSVGAGTFERTHTIEYDSSPLKSQGGVPVWKNCDHIVKGRDPLAMVYQPQPLIRWDVTSTVSFGSKEYFNYTPDSRMNIVTVYDEYSTYNWWDALRYDDILYHRNPTGIVPNSLSEALSLLSDEDLDRYQDWELRMADRFRNVTDLNRMVDSDQMFYSNILQTIFPLGRLLSGKRLFQSTVKWLSLFRARFARRPFLTALTELGKADMFYRFAVETAIRDIRDFMNSFDDIVRVYETANGANSRPWTRIALNDCFNADVYTYGERKIRIASPTRPVHRGPGTEICSVTWLPRNAIAHSNYGYQHTSRVTTPKQRDLINSGYDTYYPIALQQLFREINTDGYWTTYHGLTLSRRLQRWAKVRYKNLGSLSPLKVWQNRVGISKPLTSAWDMVPFSFVLDYFFRIGDWIEGVSNMASDAWQLRGQVIDAGPVWQCDKWSWGVRVSSNGALSSERLKSTGVDNISLSAPDTSPLADICGFHRHPVTRMKESFRFGILSDEELNATRQRTLVELGLNLLDKSQRNGTASIEETRKAITFLKLQSKGWRTPNKAIDAMSLDMFDDYLRRTLSQATHTLKQRKH